MRWVVSLIVLGLWIFEVTNLDCSDLLRPVSLSSDSGIIFPGGRLHGLPTISNQFAAT